MTFPISQSTYHIPPPDWVGDVVIADVDRTYLETRFSSVRGLIRIPLEGASDKRDIVGMASFFQGLRHGPESRSRTTPLYFVSASPSQLRPVIEAKMALDGIACDGTTFKSWTRVVRSGKLRRLREQVGFKLTALLESRLRLPRGAAETLIGDDLESDPVTFALYADALSSRRSLSEIEKTLRRCRVDPDDAQDILAKIERVQALGVAPVRKVLIRMERYLDSDRLIDFAPGVVGCRGALQMAVVAWQLGLLRDAHVMDVGRVYLEKNIGHPQIVWRLQDLVRRGVLDSEAASNLLCGIIGRTPSTWETPDPRWNEVWARHNDRPWLPRMFAST